MDVPEAKKGVKKRKAQGLPPTPSSADSPNAQLTVDNHMVSKSINSAKTAGTAVWKIAGLILLGVAIGGVLGIFIPRLWTPAVDRSTPAGLAALQDSAIPLPQGPWGNLEMVPFYIEPPDEYLPVQMIENYDPRWAFKGYTPDQLMTLFKTAGLTSKQLAEVSNTANWKQEGDTIYVTPSRELSLSLSPEARKKIYVPMISTFSAVIGTQTQIFPADRFDDCFAGSGLPPEVIETVRKFSFPYGNQLVFADTQLVLSMMPDANLKKKLLKTLMRKTTLLLRLHITPDSDLNELEHYWVRAGWGLDLRPILESLARLKDGARIDVVELLPPVPSSQIYNYRFPSLKPEEQHKDCSWTALNFFRDVPDDRFTDTDVVRQTLQNDYYPALSDPRYGDLVVLAKPNGDIIHLAVYLAAGIVYTKNSGNFRDPFILMTLQDMVDRFSVQIPEDQKLDVQFYRNKYY